MHKITPLKRYLQMIDAGKITHDPVQLQAVNLTQELYDRILETPPESVSWFERFRGRFFRETRRQTPGLYFWGSVGTGKTFIIDNFFESLPIDEKLRIHFHRFMQGIHAELKNLKNLENPLRYIANEFFSGTRVLCFDEFHVSDITDAMLLSGLLEALFDRGVILVTSSNEHPDDLYRDGLQRSRFLPAIELIKQHTQVFQLDSGIDYRLRYLDAAEIYHYPLDKKANDKLIDNFEHLAPNTGRADRTIEIEKRKIQTIHCADGVVWFDFMTICNSPRGPADYIEIARQFQTVFISGIPQMNDDMNDQVKRFITLVDEFYDRHVKLILTAAVPVDELYLGKRLAFQFERTQSRLIEMQSHDYLARRHLSD